MFFGDDVQLFVLKCKVRLIEYCDIVCCLVLLWLVEESCWHVYVLPLLFVVSQKQSEYHLYFWKELFVQLLFHCLSVVFYVFDYLCQWSHFDSLLKIVFLDLQQNIFILIVSITWLLFWKLFDVFNFLHHLRVRYQLLYFLYFVLDLTNFQLLLWFLLQLLL